MKSGTSTSWSEDDLKTLREVYPDSGAKECAKLLGRSISSVQKKAYRLKISSNNRRKWTQEEDKILYTFYSDLGVNYCLAKIKNVTKTQVYSRVKTLNLVCKNSVTKKKTTEQYINQVKALNIDVEVLQEYKTNDTPILHNHMVCGTEWLTRPRDILQGRGCPSCAKSGFNSVSEGFLYFLYFPPLGVCKLGITKDIEQRRKEFGVDSILLSSKYFKNGGEAKVTEKLFLDHFKEYLYNTGSLRSGNTETFYFDSKLKEEVISLIKVL